MREILFLLKKIDDANLKWIEGQTAVDRFFETKNTFSKNYEFIRTKQREIRSKTDNMGGHN